MADRRGPAVYSIPAHRAFADALVAGIMATNGRDMMTLARGIVLLPNNRAVRAVRDAFVRRSDGGLLMPRLVPIGDVDLGERLGNALDPMGSGLDLPPAIGPMERQMILARLVQDAEGRAGRPIDAGEAVRLGQALASSLDQMLVEQVAPESLRALDLDADLSAHWSRALSLFEVVLDHWPRELANRGMIDMADRRNRVLDHVARRWRDNPPDGFVVAAGISSTAPAICAVLHTVARMPHGKVVLSELDQVMRDEDWDAIGPFPPDPVTGRAPRSQESHPQYALKQVLQRMGVARAEVAQWRWGGGHDARAARSRTISHAMLAPAQTARWPMIPAAERTLAGVRAIACATPAQEAQAIALLLREAMETPGRTAALVTPDRALARRVAEHVRRWGIVADDSAGQPLSRLPPGTLLCALARALAHRFAPVALLALLKHPLLARGEGRLDWLDGVRALDLLLRGPRPEPGLAGIDALVRSWAGPGRDRMADARARAAAWWPHARALLAPLEQLGHGDVPAGRAYALLREGAGALSAEAVWAGHQGHAAAELFAQIEAAAPSGPPLIAMRAFDMLIERLLSGVAVRPPQGGHPRIAIYGLLEARLQQADLMILGGLNEDSWPAMPAPDPWLAPRIRAALGLPGLEHRIGLAAHDFASALGAPEVVLSRAMRSGSGPTRASRFWLRLQAMAGANFTLDTRTVMLAQSLDAPHGPPRPASRPVVDVPAALRPRSVAVTEVDRLAGDPYGFYARKILRLAPLDMVDGEPSHAWRGTQVHLLLELWAREDDGDAAMLKQRAHALLYHPGVHPLVRALWMPRLNAAIAWIAQQVATGAAQGRSIVAVEADGRTEIDGIVLTGKADRIDALPDGSVVIVDYKTGEAPKSPAVKAGYALQLGYLGMIAQRGGFAALGGAREPGGFEYWSLGRSDDGFGKLVKPGVPTEEMTERAAASFADLVGQYLVGTAPFVAKLRPELKGMTDYDPLMRLEEWYGRSADMTDG